MIYCTYIQYGVLKRAVLTETQFKKYQQDPSVSGLQSYISQRSMDENYALIKGSSVDKRTMLHG